MSIADKLTTIAENTPKVFNAGYSKGKAEDNVDLCHYATKISFRNVNFEEGTELEIFIGKNVDAPIEDFNYIFHNSRGAKRIKIECKPQTTAISMDRAFSLTGNDICLETIDLTNLQAPLTRLDLTFAWRDKLKEILGEIDCGECTSFSTSFLVCSALEYIHFQKECIKASITFSSSPKLTLESAKSILLGLFNYAGTENEFVYSVTFHSNVWDLLDAEGATAPGGITWRVYTANKGWNT